jgi:ATP phosphoribosyltransferase regulatory subunit
MSKFEEYDLYGRNKEFLISDRVITFTDTNGRLMALKPDVTLSIVKNSVDAPGYVSRLYYNENVYRTSTQTHQYKEIMQTGLECIGDLSSYHLYEVARLAAKSLGVISADSVLVLSHLGVIAAAAEGVGETERSSLLACIKEKNTAGLASLCEQYGLSKKQTALLSAISTAHGSPAEVIAKLSKLSDTAAMARSLDELSQVAAVCDCANGVRVCVDFSLVGDMNYYNGIIFQGFVNGLPSCVLSGGQYDRLMEKMGKSAKAIGFAVYLDQLERLAGEPPYDVDTLLVCSKDTDPRVIMERVEAIIAEGKSVVVQETIPAKLRYRSVETLSIKEA